MVFLVRKSLVKGNAKDAADGTETVCRSYVNCQYCGAGSKSDKKRGKNQWIPRWQVLVGKFIYIIVGRQCINDWVLSQI